MDVLVVESRKGGVGKTTLATTLAGGISDAGLGPVVVIDLDPQSSLSEWFDDRLKLGLEGIVHLVTTAANLAYDLARVKQMGYKYAIIDTPGYLAEVVSTARSLATLVLIPTGPSPLDLKATRTTIALVKKAGKPFMFVLSRAKPRTKLTHDAMVMLSRTGPVAGTYGDLNDYPTAMIDGRLAQEFNPKGAAAQEVHQVTAAVIEQLQLSRTA